MSLWFQAAVFLLAVFTLSIWLTRVYLVRSTSFQGRLLKHNLDSEVVDALRDLKTQLSKNESDTQSS